MSDLYTALCTGRTEHRAELVCAINDLLVEGGYEDMLAARLTGMIIDPEIDGRVDKIESTIIQCGCNRMQEAGIWVNFDDVYRQPDILLTMIKTIFHTIDNWEDYESLLDMISTETAYGLSTVIATVSGTLTPSVYMDVIVMVEDRFYETLIAYVNQKVKLQYDEEPERLNRRIVDLVREFCKRCPTNPVAANYVACGLDADDSYIMSQIDYEYEELAPQQYYKNLSESIAGLVVRKAEFYSDAYDLINDYAELLVESDEPRDILAVCKAANALIKDIYTTVEKAADEEV